MVVCLTGVEPHCTLVVLRLDLQLLQDDLQVQVARIEHRHTHCLPQAIKKARMHADELTIGSSLWFHPAEWWSPEAAVRVEMES